MAAPTPEEVRSALVDFDARHEKIVAGMLTVMIKNPNRVRDREWMAEQLTELTLLASEFEVKSTPDGVRVIQDFLQRHSEELLRASFLLFQRVGLDLAPRAAEGFTFEEAMECGLQYLPSAKDENP